MSTGKELVRMMSCGIWDENVKSHKCFCSAQIYNDKGKPISLEKAKTQVFCHARVLVKDLDDDALHLLGVLLQMVASTSGESMGVNIFTFYGFQEIIIS